MPEVVGRCDQRAERTAISTEIAYRGGMKASEGDTISKGIRIAPYSGDALRSRHRSLSKTRCVATGATTFGRRKHAESCIIM